MGRQGKASKNFPAEEAVHAETYRQEVQILLEELQIFP